ncbi:hypothetical protein [Rhodococcoides yunnanense]|uniref:hypothetical protein n=1 Tax=Rhodococcoides yunnanense TaxID=278209 RepID=UPI001FE65E0F|nr:hypothetical protein [Rhodococcus yunnanensis]
MTTDLTFVERTTLLVLMAESRSVRLAELPDLGSALAQKSRTKLESAGLIRVEKVGRGNVLELTDAGWARGSEEFGAETPPRASNTGGKALYTLLRAMRRYFDRVGIEPNEVFLPTAPEMPAAVVDKPVATEKPDVVAAPIDVETRIRSAHSRLARDAKSFVSLTRLRAELSDLDRSAVDEVLSSLYRAQKINLIPEANQKTLTDEDRSAALHIGGQNRHNVEFK